MQLEKNSKSRCRKTYVYVHAALAIHGQTAKKNLKQSPFVVFLYLEQTMRDTFVCTTTWPFHSRTVLIASEFCIHTLTLPSSLITRKDTQKWHMAWKPIACTEALEEHSQESLSRQYKQRMVFLACTNVPLMLASRNPTTSNRAMLGHSG